VQVFERAAAMEEVGAGISLWANALHALDRLGVGPAVESASLAYEAGGLRLKDGTALISMSVADLTRQVGRVVVVLHRADLHAALLQALPPDVVRLGMTCTGFDRTPGGVTAAFAGGQAAHGDLLIGADGLRSVIRAGLHGDRPPRYAGCTAWRAVVPFDHSRVQASESWGAGRLFGLVPISGSRVYWYAAKNTAEGGRSPHPRGELLELFADWHAPIPALIAAADDRVILRNDIYDRPGLQRWGEGRVSLLGDAAHPMTPFLGQGACQALEDAVVLGDCMAQTADVPNALRRYEQTRIRRANMFVRQSRIAGRVARLEHPIAAGLRNALLRRINPARHARSLARMIGYRV
jgi:2-polyprenyl-6-methoxyphenol hydroxylase-like FAD-dependent oxidoreductase